MYQSIFRARIWLTEHEGGKEREELHPASKALPENGSNWLSRQTEPLLDSCVELEVWFTQGGLLLACLKTKQNTLNHC